MNLKLKVTLLWLLAIVITILSTIVIIATVNIILLHLEIVLVTCIIAFMIYVLISAWVSIYKYLKSKEETK